MSICYLIDAYRDLKAPNDDADGRDGVGQVRGGASLFGDPRESPDQRVFNPPRIDYFADVSNYNAGHPGSPVFLPYFGGYDSNGNFQGLDLDIFGITQFRGGDNAIARDIEVAVDWHPATNAFQGYYLLDAFAGVHYVNNAEVLAFLDRPENRDVLVPKVTNSRAHRASRRVQVPRHFGFKPCVQITGANRLSTEAGQRRISTDTSPATEVVNSADHRRVDLITDRNGAAEGVDGDDAVAFQPSP